MFNKLIFITLLISSFVHATTENNETNPRIIMITNSTQYNESNTILVNYDDMYKNHTYIGNVSVENYCKSNNCSIINNEYGIYVKLPYTNYIILKNICESKKTKQNIVYSIKNTKGVDGLIILSYIIMLTCMMLY